MDKNDGKKAKIDQSVIIKTLDWAYEKATTGVPGVDSAQEIAESYLNKKGTLYEQANSLIRWQNAKCTTSGFLSGLGGIITMPVAIPANIASVIYVQIRMIAAIAYMGGYDVRDDRVKALVYSCMAGNAAKDIIKEIGIKIGTKLTNTAIKRVSVEVIKKINQAVGFRLLTKFGSTGAINLGKAIPFVGGIIGGTFDGVSTNTIGNVARNTFITTENFEQEDSEEEFVEECPEKNNQQIDYLKLLSELKRIANHTNSEINSEKVEMIKTAIFNSGIDNRKKVIDLSIGNLIFDINKSIINKNNLLSWKMFFVETISGYYFYHCNNTETDIDSITEWLLKRINESSQMDENIKFLLLNFKESAKSIPPKLKFKIDFCNI